MEKQLKIINQQIDILNQQYSSEDLYHKYYQFYTPIFQRINKIYTIIFKYFEDEYFVCNILNDKMNNFLKSTYKEWINFEDSYTILDKKNNCLTSMTQNIGLYL